MSRDEVTLDMEKISGYLTGKTVLDAQNTIAYIAQKEVILIWDN